VIKKEFLYLGWYIIFCIPIIIVYIKFSTKAKREWLALTGQIKPRVVPGAQKREYIRLESAFPVEFQRIEEGKPDEFNIHQGFTRDISKDGLSIETVTVRERPLEELVPNKTRLRLFIDVPQEGRATTALATVRWVHRTEDLTVDRYSIGVSYDEIAELDLTKIIRYALWFRRRPDIFAIVMIAALMLVIAFIGSGLLFRETSAQLQKKISRTEDRLAAVTVERDEVISQMSEIKEELEALKFKRGETRQVSRAPSPVIAKSPVIEVEVEEEEMVEEEVLEPDEPDEAEPTEDEVEEILEPIVELRAPQPIEDEIVVEPNITRKMIDSESQIYKTFRDYILKEETQLLDRYTSLHRMSIYHAASLFALAELRYKKGHIKEMTQKAYRDVIKLYPQSKYASYASHRLEQITNNLPYNTRSLRYYSIEYNLSPLYDYRELEPYKE